MKFTMGALTLIFAVFVGQLFGGGGRGGSISICSCFNGHNSTPRAYLESDGGGGMALELPVVAFVVEQVVIIYWLDIRTMH